jgi:hypothetical protein
MHPVSPALPLSVRISQDHNYPVTDAARTRTCSAQKENRNRQCVDSARRCFIANSSQGHRRECAIAISKVSHPSLVSCSRPTICRLNLAVPVKFRKSAHSLRGHLLGRLRRHVWSSRGIAAAGVILPASSEICFWLRRKSRLIATAAKATQAR